ncbi:hypothetical protein cyc_00223 [Cyclospora cayetanensis]|uniref:Uncharacterized protein n=1 Tax=Cyclospora cayetanensis TaxID=88456 RepID=A0A1D3CU87_9EIME|nr:hypothetical protein cyc_00223 [Cyclospora cayetanensis]
MRACLSDIKAMPATPAVPTGRLATAKRRSRRPSEEAGTGSNAASNVLCISDTERDVRGLASLKQQSPAKPSTAEGSTEAPFVASSSSSERRTYILPVPQEFDFSMAICSYGFFCMMPNKASGGGRRLTDRTLHG